jgi:hypothetical protein
MRCIVLESAFPLVLQVEFEVGAEVRAVGVGRHGLVGVAERELVLKELGPSGGVRDEN